MSVFLDSLCLLLFVSLCTYLCVSVYLCLYFYKSLRLYICLYLYLYLSFCLSLFVSFYVSFCMSVSLYVCASLCLCVSLFFYIYVPLSLCPCLSVSVYVCMSVSVFLCLCLFIPVSPSLLTLPTNTTNTANTTINRLCLTVTVTVTVTVTARTLGGHTEAVGSLLRAGADTSIGEENHYTPLHGAGFQGRAPALKLLLAHGLNPLDMHQDGFLPLHRACWGMEKKHTDTVRVFLKAGVDPKSPALNGKNCAQMSKNQGTLDLLRSYSDDDDVDTAAELR
ncbi:hypothetical protein B484DRAFT_156085 [Ochromonadaceae sp. CCMP2298]|nr:hypothetical protein B484DRAFT_156085 [Ochromonadaceae sp. CCMP2298]